MLPGGGGWLSYTGGKKVQRVEIKPNAEVGVTGASRNSPTFGRLLFGTQVVKILRTTINYSST